MKNIVFAIFSLALICCLCACNNNGSTKQEDLNADAKYEVQTSTSEKVKVGDDLRLGNNCIKKNARFEENPENYINYQLAKNGSVTYSGSVDKFVFDGKTENLTDRIRVGNAYMKLEFIVDINCQFVKGVRLTKKGDGQKWENSKFKLIRI